MWRNNLSIFERGKRKTSPGLPPFVYFHPGKYGKPPALEQSSLADKHSPLLRSGAAGTGPHLCKPRCPRNLGTTWLCSQLTPRGHREDWTLSQCFFPVVPTSSDWSSYPRASIMNENKKKNIYPELIISVLTLFFFLHYCFNPYENLMRSYC